MASWRDSLVDDVRTLVLRECDWITRHLLALTEKTTLAQLQRLERERWSEFAPAPLTQHFTIPRKPLHPLMFLAHGYICHPIVKAHPWTWGDIADLAQCRGGWLYIEPLLLARKHLDDGDFPVIQPHRTTLANMLILRSYPIWKRAFVGRRGLQQVIDAGNSDLILSVLHRADLSLFWPETVEDVLQEIAMSDRTFDVFFAVWKEYPRTDKSLCDIVERRVDYTLFQKARALGMPVVARVRPAIKSGELDYLREALNVVREERHWSDLEEAVALRRPDMVSLLIDDGYEWPPLEKMLKYLFADYVNCGFDPFGHNVDQRCLEYYLEGLPSSQLRLIIDIDTRERLVALRVKQETIRQALRAVNADNYNYYFL